MSEFGFLEEDVTVGVQLETIAKSRGFLRLLEALRDDADEAREQAALLNVRDEEGQRIHEELKVRVLAHRLLVEKVEALIASGAEAERVLGELAERG